MFRGTLVRASSATELQVRREIFLTLCSFSYQTLIVHRMLASILFHNNVTTLLAFL